MSGQGSSLRTVSRALVTRWFMALVWVSAACHGADPSGDELGTDPGNADSTATLTLLTLGASAQHVTQAVNLPPTSLLMLAASPVNCACFSESISASYRSWALALKSIV